MNIFSYTALVSDVGVDSVTLIVSVRGKDMVLKSPLSYFPFNVEEGMRIVVEGVNRGGEKQLHFREIKPLVLDAEHEAMLVDILASFEKI